MKRHDFTIKKGIVTKKSEYYLTIRHLDGFETVISYRGPINVKDTVFTLKIGDTIDVFKTFEESIKEIDRFFTENT